MMDPSELAAMLLATLDDRRLSRAERAALRSVLDEQAPSSEKLASFRHKAFSIAQEAAETQHSRELIGWLEDVIKLFIPKTAPAAVAEVRFSPGDACLRLIQDELDRARTSADICVFTITDDRIAARIVSAHTRGVRVRIITDDDKSEDLGSDIERLAAAGIPVRRDRTEHHMHHKFAVLDDERLLSGSYNWTRSAAAHNEENVLLTADTRLVRPYRRAFEELWAALALGCAPRV